MCDAAAELGADVVDLHELEQAAGYYGAPPPALPAERRPRGMRDRFFALFDSRVGD